MQNHATFLLGMSPERKDESKYCSSYGERSCEDDEELVLMEANDNHEEAHTVAEFIEFCGWTLN